MIHIKFCFNFGYVDFRFWKGIFYWQVLQEIQAFPGESVSYSIVNFWKPWKKIMVVNARLQNKAKFIKISSLIWDCVSHCLVMIRYFVFSGYDSTAEQKPFHVNFFSNSGFSWHNTPESRLVKSRDSVKSNRSWKLTLNFIGRFWLNTSKQNDWTLLFICTWNGNLMLYVILISMKVELKSWILFLILYGLVIVNQTDRENFKPGSSPSSYFDMYQISVTMLLRKYNWALEKLICVSWKYHPRDTTRQQKCRRNLESVHWFNLRELRMKYQWNWYS